MTNPVEAALYVPERISVRMTTPLLTSPIRTGKVVSTAGVRAARL